MDPNLITSLLPILNISVIIAFVSHFLAKEKGRNVTLWTVLGCIPGINFLLLLFFVGAANLKLEAKVDAIAKQLNVNK